MNIIELKKLLIESNVPSNHYSLKGGFPSEALVIAKSNNGWEVYYSERGLKSGRMEFLNENDACIYFYSLIKEYAK